ncbi:hypothetical protein K469DRAFT_737542 [Zopfia rhizophila CBS 207.26]|uniref:DNA polymerase delta subunit 3 n=1 Tax=Zopfia rhizophila CBS 207.26 TaxID=1314779 RepID=A0A6A6EBI7_9PEZI|nr:hypothetical protein K469DRAFT_737542 [Zopfia rhizophila CBS 207.26]
MTENYKEYLAARVLTDNRIVTYRLASRALRVNVNIAKQMLHDFYLTQNANKQKSVHATFLLTGKRRNPEHTNGIHAKDGEDTFMHSSPYMSSLPEPEEPEEEPVPVTSMVLVREEELEKTKAEFEEVTSIHVYSLEPGLIENMNMLSVCNQEIAKDYINENPLEGWKTYGSIHNSYIKRRTAKFAPPPSAAPKSAPKTAVKPSAAGPSKEKETAATATRGSTSEDNTSARSTPQSSSGSNTLKKSDSKSNLKRDRSDIFRSFAKAKAKPKEAEKSKESTPAPPEDEPMQDMSEDEADENDAPEIAFDEQKAAAARKARAEREEKLRKMMEDDDDEEMVDASPTEEKESDDAPLDKAPSGKSEESEAAVTVQGGRRRGRRRVMKKKKVKDEDGYLVTKEEMVWESFSEDEPEPKKPKPAPTKSSTTAAKGKKTGKQGQGSIASFFKKA